MRRLLLLRHAKAAPHDPARDHARSLIERGRADAKRMGEVIAGEKWPVDLVVHSGARRAKETALIAHAELPKGVPVSVEPRLYEATTAGFVAALRDLPNSAETIVVVGHNPSLAEAAARLAAGGDRAALARMAAKFPTAGLAVLDFDLAHWTDLAAGKGRLIAFFTPSTLLEDD
jgi:phosphohistidine phosphatase